MFRAGQGMEDESSVALYSLPRIGIADELGHFAVEEGTPRTVLGLGHYKALFNPAMIFTTGFLNHCN